MIEIHIDADSIKTYDGEEMTDEIIGTDMNISDFDMGSIGLALALYTVLCNMDDDEAVIKFV